MSEPPFLDTNVILRHVLDDNPNHSPRSQRLFAQIARGERTVQTADTVIFEAVYTMERVYHVSREDIRDALTSILRLDGVFLARKELYPAIFALFAQYRSISFADCYHAVLAMTLNAAGILSFDQDFDRLPSIERHEPD